jgi:hypothetical protein
MTAPPHAALRAAMVEASSRFTVHFNVCRARTQGLFCLRCHQLEQIALDAADRYEAARRRKAVVR